MTSSINTNRELGIKSCFSQAYKYLKRNLVEIDFFSVAILTLFICVVVIFVFILILNYFYFKYPDRVFCLEKECVDSFLDSLYAPMKFLTFGAKLITFFVGVFGAFFAISIYDQSVKNNALATHLAHYRNFHQYVNYLIDQRPRLSGEFIDIFYLHKFIFPESRTGSYDVSADYLNFIKDLNAAISDYNKGRSGGKEVVEPFKDYQKKLRELFKRLKIILPLKPNQSDFHNVESDLYELLAHINTAFIDGSDVETAKQVKLETRYYA